VPEFGPKKSRPLYVDNSLLNFMPYVQLQKLKTSKYFKELIFNTLLFADDQCIISDTEDNLQKAVYLLYSISKEYNLEIATKKTMYLVSLGQIT